jgi:hypothetical protein
MSDKDKKPSGLGGGWEKALGGGINGIPTSPVPEELRQPIEVRDDDVIQFAVSMKATPIADDTPAGTRVLLVEDEEMGVTFTRTRSEVWRLGHGERVVLVEGRTGGYLASRIFVIPEGVKPCR